MQIRLLSFKSLAAFGPIIQSRLTSITLIPLIYLMNKTNKYRRSDCSIKQLSNFLEQTHNRRLRTTVGNSSQATFDFSHYRTTIGNQQPQKPEPYLPSFKKQIPTLKEQFSSLQEKVNMAKMQIKMESGGHQKIHKSVLSKEEMPPQTPTTASSTNLYSARFDFIQKQMQEDKLQLYTSAQIKPQNVSIPRNNPYRGIKNSGYYVTQAVRAMHQKSSLAVQHVCVSINILRQFQQTLDEERRTHKANKIRVPKPISKIYRKTLLLDLDQTLIHCYENADCEPDLTLQIDIDNSKVQINFSIRPHAMTFLKKMSKKWQIIIFTASHKSYADAILDQLDPEGILIHHRLYRHHCSISNDMYVKDLSLINRDLKDMVLVDNAAYSYAFQLDNGIPILPFYDGKDYQLSALEGYLEKLYEAEDVRDMNRRHFKLDRYTQFDNSQQLIEELYAKREEDLHI